LEKWLERYAKPNVAPKTFERYAEIVNAHLTPALGDIVLGKLQPLHIQEYYSQALESGRRNGQGGLAAQTVLHHHRVLREALRQAMRWQMISRNAADAAQPPHPVRPEFRVLDERQTATLLAATRNTTLYIPVLLAVTTGMRRGELLALRWCNIDLSAGTASVQGSLEETKEGLRFKRPKTQKGSRVVVLPSMTIEALRRHKARQAKEKLLLGAAYHDDDLVCAAADGNPIRPSAVSESFARLVRKPGAVRVRFHDLRHTHATHLLRQGVHPKIVSERLGHSTIAITLDVYSHVLPGMQKEAAQLIDASLRTALRSRR
jgi:integrase